MSPAAILLVALVAEDGTGLRSAPSDAAPTQATLHRGDWLEVRGHVPGFLKVWDHRRERPGYVRPQRVRLHRAEESSADELRAVVRFLRDAQGYESLGVGYAALYLRVAPPARRAQPEWAEVLGALGSMADRLAARASGSARVRTTGGARAAEDAALAGQLSVVESYGVGYRRFEESSRMASGERGQRFVVCYDGDAFARVLSMTVAAAEERARAALALTRRPCFDPVTTVEHRHTWNEARLTVLSEASPSRPELGQLPRPLAHRLRLRTAEALVERAHGLASRGDAMGSVQSASEAMRLLALVDRGELAPEDEPVYQEAAVRVASVRALGEPVAPNVGRHLAVEIVAAAGRQTCVRIWPQPRATSGARPLVERCTFGVVFASSVRVASHGRAVAVSVAPVVAWTELWIFHAEASSGGWRSDVVPPAIGEPGEDIGYVELAGFSPDGTRVMLARESRVQGRLTRRFEVCNPEGTVLHWATDQRRLGAFARWASVGWRRSSLALR